MRKEWALAAGVASAFCTFGCDAMPSSRVATTTVAVQWRVEDSGTSDTLVGVWGTGSDDVWVVGTRSILRSHGDGVWAQVGGGSTDQYTAVFGSDGVVLVAGMECEGGVCTCGMLLRSRDGGAHWTRQALPTVAWGFARGADGTVYLALEGAVLASRDGFETSVSHPVDTLQATRGVFVGDDGAVLTYGGLRTYEIRRSEDGGDSWTTVFSGGGGSRSGHVDAMWGIGASLWATANGSSVPRSFGALLRSDDGGRSFAPASLPDLDGVAGVWGASADDVYIAGRQLLHAVDGRTFAAVTLPVAADWLGVWGSRADDVYVVGLGGAIVHLR